MQSFKAELAMLRRKIAQIDRTYAAPSLKHSVPRCQIEDVVSGQVVETELGSHFETERLYARHRRH